MLATAKTDNELTITVSNLHDVYQKQESVSVSALVTLNGVPQPGTTITFSFTDSKGESSGSITRITDANGQMTCTHNFTKAGPRGTHTLEIFVEKNGLTGYFTATFEVVP